MFVFGGAVVGFGSGVDVFEAGGGVAVFEVGAGAFVAPGAGRVEGFF
jgi:hypothetical protein